MKTLRMLCLLVVACSSSGWAESLKRYVGSVGERQAEFRLDWKEDGSVKGDYFYTDGNRAQYQLLGNNKTEGVLELNVYSGQIPTARIFLNKKTQGGSIIWEGNLKGNDGRILAVSFSRQPETGLANPSDGAPQVAGIGPTEIKVVAKAEPVEAIRRAEPVETPPDSNPKQSWRQNAGGAGANVRHLDSSSYAGMTCVQLYEIIGNSQYDLYTQSSAFTHLERYASKPAAYYYLAQCYISGRTGAGGPVYAINQKGFPKDRLEAYKLGIPLLEKAAELGHVPSLLYLADLFGTGRFVDRDTDKAANYWSMAAAKGDKIALDKLKEWYFGTSDSANNQSQRAAALKVLAENGVEEAKIKLDTIASTTDTRALPVDTKSDSSTAQTNDLPTVGRNAIPPQIDQRIKPPTTPQTPPPESSNDFVFYLIFGTLLVIFVKYPRAFLAILAGLFEASASKASTERDSKGSNTPRKPSNVTNKERHFCKYCGNEYSDLQVLTSFSCTKGPTKHHEVYEGPVKSKYACIYCGKEYSDLQALTSFSCTKSPTKHHIPYEGSKKSRYACKYCGKEYSDLQALTSFSCTKSPTKHHIPAR